MKYLWETSSMQRPSRLANALRLMVVYHLGPLVGEVKGLRFDDHV